MTQIFATVTEGLQNVYTPLPLKIHFILCIIATVVYLMQFYRRGSWHYLMLMIAFDLTFITQTSLCRSSSAVGILAIAEAAVLAAAIVLYVSFTRAQKAMKAAENAEIDEAEERRKAAEKAQTAEDKKIVDNAFSDADDE